MQGTMARPSKRTEELVLDVVARVQDGVPVKLAAAAAGVDATTLWRWRQKDAELDHAIDRARALWVTRQVLRIDAAADKDWKAAAFLLERGEPGSFGKRTVVEVETQPTAVFDPVAGHVISASTDAGSDDEPEALAPGDDLNPQPEP